MSFVPPDIDGLLEDAFHARSYDDEEHARHGSSDTARAFLEEILDAYAIGGHGLRTLPLARAGAPGLEWHSTGLGAGELLRELSQLTHALEEALVMRHKIGLEERRRFRAIADEATARALDALEPARKRRRAKWLAYFAHEMRNSLNTLVNAVWILRNSERQQTQKICDMAERAVKKLEKSINEVRELDAHVVAPAPGRPDEDGDLVQ